jgi:hypothetical protein
MRVPLAGCRVRVQCRRGLLAARDHQGYEHHGYDQRPHGRENSGETSDRCKEASGNRPSGQKQRAGQDEDAAADERAEPEDEAAVPTPNQPNRLRDSCSDKQAAEKEPEPPGPAVHLPTVSAQTRGSALPALISQSSLPSRTNAACERPRAGGGRCLPAALLPVPVTARTDRATLPTPDSQAKPPGHCWFRGNTNRPTST